MLTPVSLSICHLSLQRNAEEGEAQQPEGTTRTDSSPGGPSRPSDETWAFSWVFPSTTDDAALPTTNFSDIRPWDSEQEEDITKEKPPVRKWVEQSSYPRIKNYRPREYPVLGFQSWPEALVEWGWHRG